MLIVKKKCVAGEFPAVQFLRMNIRTSNIVLRQQTAVYGNVHGGQLVEMSVFYKIERILYPYPQTPSPREGAILLGLPPLDQARMLAVSHTKPLHDAVAQMADDLYGGFAPATPFQYLQEVFRQTDRRVRKCTRR